MIRTVTRFKALIDRSTLDGNDHPVRIESMSAAASSDWWISREERGHFHVWIISLLSTLSQPQEQSTRIIRGGGKVNDLHRVFCFETFVWWTAIQTAPSEHYILHFVNCNVKFARGSAVAPESCVKRVWWYISPLHTPSNLNVEYSTVFFLLNL